VTGLTTVIGFGSLITSDMQVIRHFGLFTAFGIAAALFIAIAPLPLLLTMLPQPKKAAEESFSPFLVRAVRFFTDSAVRGWKRNLALALALLIICIAGIPKIFIETKPVDFYPRGTDVPREFYFFDAKFNGSTTMDLVVNGPPGSFAEPQVLAQVDHMRAAAEQKFDDGGALLSVVDYLKKANQALHDGDPAHFAIPPTREAVEQIYLLLSGNEHFSDLITPDFSSIRMHQQVKAVGSRNGKRIMATANQIREKHLGPPFESYFAGSNVVWMNMEHYIVRAQLAGLSGTVLITLLLIFLLRSVKWGLISMIPNIFPIIGIFGVMGWFGVPLNMLTTTIASIAIGLAVDDTVHLMLHIRADTARGMGIDDAIRAAFAKTGPAVVSTSCVLALGFWTLCSTAFIPTRQFGALGGLTFVFGMIGELVLLPAVLKLLTPWLTRERQVTAALEGSTAG
jgi:predicted RND superfamily exporter protein